MIIELYFQRSEKVIEETDKKYHGYCENIGMNILNNYQDTEECINDCYLNAWNCMPPEKPKILHAFLGRIMRNLSIDRYRKNKAQKRKEGEFHVLLDELEECIPTNTSVWDSVNERLLSTAIDDFLTKCTEKEKNIFIKRYFFCKSVKAIAKECTLTDANIKTILHRLRKALKNYLQKRGYEM